MSPKMPAVVTPMASATTITPSGIASMAARVDIGLPQLSGVARSSRAGTKRKVNAEPIRRGPPGTNGFGPCIQHRLIPFVSNMVVMVAVVTLRRTSNMAAFMKSLVERKSNARIASRPLSGISNQMPGIKS
jgi:hypothetical protein